MRNALIFITIISLIMFVIITITRIIMAIFFRYLIKKYMMLRDLIRGLDKKDDEYIPSGVNDVMYRDKDIEMKKEQEVQRLVNVKRLSKDGNEDISNDIINYERALDDDIDYRKNIVGLVKPVGRWTSLILGNKVTYLMQHAETLKTQNDATYWQNMRFAKDRSKGKGRGRGL
jgi:hypothetical protein